MKPQRSFRPRLEQLEGRLTPSTYPLSSVPVLNSLPGAAATLYLDFDGDFQAQWGGYTNITTPAFDQDGDATTFSDAELTAMNQIWRIATEDYVPFNINVTTVAPPSFADNVALHVVIGGDASWYGGAAGGVATPGSFSNLAANVVFVFAKNLSNGNWRLTGDTVAHEAGHSFGLAHQSLYGTSGNVMQSYYSGPGDGTGPTMGASYSAARSLWWYGTSTSATTYQDDMATIASSTNGFGYRPDDVGNTAAAAAPLTLSGSQISASGIIGTMADLDYYSFATGAGQVNLTVQAPPDVNDLSPLLELRDVNGTLIAAAGPDANFNASITTTLAAGTYYLVVASNGPSALSTPTNYGLNVGSYTVTGTIVGSGTSTVNAPSGLSAQAASASQVNLAWTNNAANATGSRIDRSSDGVNWTQLASLAGTATAYADGTVTGGMTFYYQVRAVSGSSLSDPSNEASATLVPVAPAGLTASAASPTQINLSWSDVTGESGYKLERSTNGATWTQVATTAAGVTSYQDVGLSGGSTYYYRVRAWNSAGNSGYSSQASAATPAAPTPPAAPANLSAAAVDSYRINLTWADVAGETGYKIERSTNGVSFTQIASTAAGITSYQDSGLAASTTYYYRVRASNAVGDSAASNVAQATTPVLTAPTAPSNLTAAQLSATQVKLTWVDNSGTETGFVIQRQAVGGKWATIAQVGANVTTFSDATVSARKKYLYRVNAINQAGNSPYSNVAEPTAAAALPDASVPDAFYLPIKAARNLLYDRLPDEAIDNAVQHWLENGFFPE